MTNKGDTYHYLTFIRDLGTRKWSRWWLMKCTCGVKKEFLACHVKSGATKSCGCYKYSLAKGRLTTHGKSRTPTHNSWLNMLQRCMNDKHPSYKNYGGRGIKVCRRWRNSFSNFFEDMGERPPGTTLERSNNDGNYSPSNCVWADRFKQAQNSRRAKLNPSIVREMRGLHKKGLSCVEIAKKYKAARSTVNSAIKGTSWKNIK